METVLHIEPIVRQTPTPLNIGHHDSIEYGSVDDDQYERSDIRTSTLDLGSPIGDHPPYLTIGAPLETLDQGSTLSHIPLVKTVECYPDPKRAQSHIFSETIHFRHGRHLVPFRSKLRNSAGGSYRITHLAGLNTARKTILPNLPFVKDPKGEIVESLLTHDRHFQTLVNPSLKDWLTDEFIPYLDSQTCNYLSFDSADTSLMIQNYLDAAQHTTSEFGVAQARTIISSLQDTNSDIPTRYKSNRPAVRSLDDYRHRLVTHGVDLRLPKHIAIRRLKNIVYNPYAFQHTCEFVDSIPLTDFNVDFVISPDDEILFFHAHSACDRIGLFMGVDTGLYQGDTILRDYFDGPSLNAIVNGFFQCSQTITPEIEDILLNEPVKIKIIKTMSDEACVLLYRFDSHGDAEPLCGVYFDIALQSLAPMSIMTDYGQV